MKQKIEKVHNLFPTVDETTVKLIFYELRDNLEDTVNCLRTMFPDSYRAESPSVSATPSISPPKRGIGLSFPPPEIKVVSARAAAAVSENYDQKLGELEHSRHLMCLLFQAASLAASAGNMQRAKELSREGKKHQEAFKQLSDQTADETFRRTNRHNDYFMVDLHGLRVGAALSILDSRLEAIKQQMPRTGTRSQHVEIVTGKGLHSFNRVPKIKPAVVKYLNEKNYSFRENEGTLTVYLTSSL